MKSNYDTVLNGSLFQPHVPDTFSGSGSTSSVYVTGRNHWARICMASFLFALFSIAAKLNIASALHQLISRCGLSFESQRMAVGTVEWSIKRQNPRNQEYGMFKAPIKLNRLYAIDAFIHHTTSSLWCHFQQCPWDLGSVPAEKGSGWVHPKGAISAPRLNLAVESLWSALGRSFLSSLAQMGSEKLFLKVRSHNLYR